jgi:hypothetical protein
VLSGFVCQKKLHFSKTRSRVASQTETLSPRHQQLTVRLKIIASYRLLGLCHVFRFRFFPVYSYLLSQMGLSAQGIGEQQVQPTNTVREYAIKTNIVRRYILINTGPGGREIIHCQKEKQRFMISPYDILARTSSKP